MTKRIPGPGGIITSLSVSSDGTRLCAGDFSGNVRVWDTVSWKVLRKLQHSRIVTVSFLPESNEILVDGGTGIYLWSLARDQMTLVIPNKYLEAEHLTVSPNGKFVAVHNWRKSRNEVWELDGFDKAKLIGSHKHADVIESIAFSTDSLL